MLIPNGLEETDTDKEAVGGWELPLCHPAGLRTPNLVAGLVAEDPGLLADLVRGISLALSVGGQQVAVGLPVRQAEAWAGLDAQRGHGAGAEGSGPQDNSRRNS